MGLMTQLLDSDWFELGCATNLRARRIADMPPELSKRTGLQTNGKQLQAKIGQLNLVIEALARTVINGGLIKPKELAELMHQIDLEDGEADGQLHEERLDVPEWCPECDARIPFDKLYCVFCGYRFGAAFYTSVHVQSAIEEYGELPV